MSRRPPPALPPQSEDPVPMEHDSSDGDGGAWMLDACPALLNSVYTSPPRLLPPPSAWDWEMMMVSVGHLTPSPPRSPSPLWNFDDEQLLPRCSAWATMVVEGHLHPSPPRSPTGFIQLWEFDDGQRLPLQMGPTANCSAAVLQAAPQDTSHGIATFRVQLKRELNRLQMELLFISRELAKKLAAGIRVLEKIFLSHGLEILMNTETGRCSLATIERSDDDSDRINRARARRSGPDSVPTTLQLAAVICDMAKTLKSYGLGKHVNTETGGSSLAMIESYDGDNELGDNDAEQSEISRKRPRSRSLVWLHFTKVLSKYSGKVTAMCKHCNYALKGASTLGTSHLLRHLKKFHQMDLSSLSETWKEPQRSSCSQKLQITGSAACAGIPTPLTENNGKEIELQDKDFEVGDTSRKRLKGTSRTKSDVWKHFTKLPSADRGGVMAECNYCKKTLKADSQNGTSHLWRHFKKVHVEKTKFNYPN